MSCGGCGPGTIPAMSGSSPVAIGSRSFFSARRCRRFASFSSRCCWRARSRSRLVNVALCLTAKATSLWPGRRARVGAQLAATAVLLSPFFRHLSPPGDPAEGELRTHAGSGADVTPARPQDSVRSHRRATLLAESGNRRRGQGFPRPRTRRRGRKSRRTAPGRKGVDKRPSRPNRARRRAEPGKTDRPVVPEPWPLPPWRAAATRAGRVVCSPATSPARLGQKRLCPPP